MSAQHPNKTGWQLFREEQAQKLLADALALVKFLKAPADVRRWSESRKAHVTEDKIVPFEEWERTHTGGIPQLPPPSNTDAIRLLPPKPRHSDALLTLPPTRHDPALHMAPEMKQEVLSQFGTRPSKPLEGGPVPVQHTGEIVKEDRFLAIGPLFEPMDKVPTSRPLTASERAAMAAAAGDIFEAPAQPGSNTWEEFEALASKSGLLPIVETEFPTVETPAIVAKRQAERAAARRERYRLPDLEQRESE